MKERIQAVDIPGPAGRLEALHHVDEEADPRAVAVICHPHPLYGGTMHNKVVYRVDRALFGAGLATLRFNYRGVGRSAGRYGDGEGEREDTRAALAFMAEQWPGKPIVAAGFSFGADKALAAGWDDPRVAALVLLGTPGEAVAGRSAAGAPKPVLLVHGDADDLLPVEPIARWAEALRSPSRLVVVAGADHFFASALDEVERAVGDFARDVLAP